MDHSSSPPTLLWFRRQLRVHDQPLLEILDPDQPACGVYVLDPREHLVEFDGLVRSGSNRMQFLLDSVEALRTGLAELGVELLIRVGEPESVLPELVEQLGANRLHFVEEPGPEERAVERAVLTRLGDRARSLPVETLLELDDPREFSRGLREVFSTFRRTAEKKMTLGHVRPGVSSLTGAQRPNSVPLGSIPTLAELEMTPVASDPRGVLEFQGGEPAALARLDDWIFKEDHLRRYKETRNGMLGSDYSSKFSPWLALGCLSPRFVASETLRYEKERVANDSTYWLRFELLWREFFRFYLLKHDARLFAAQGPLGIRLDWSDRSDHFEAWRSGKTGVPLVDANMRELAATGFMSNRGRQIVASFLSKNLDVDWRRGARWFEHSLIDYCPAANWGNWTYAAGVGADPRGFRGFDIARQARQYDPDGTYVAHWLPEELSNYHGEQRHAPWLHGGPAPIVSPEPSLRAAQRRWNQAHEHTEKHASYR